MECSNDIVRLIKNKIIKELINDNEIVEALDPISKNEEGWSPIYLKYSKANKQANQSRKIEPQIFDFKKLPDVEEDVQTFILVLVQILSPYINTSTTVNPRLEIWVISHYEHLLMENNTIEANRNDYLAELIKIKFNRKDPTLWADFQLYNDTEDIFDKKHVYRKLEFTCTTFNMDLCQDDD